jgi:hypothetical protein
LLLTGNQLAPVLPSLRHPLLVAHATTMRPSTPCGLVVFIGCLHNFEDPAAIQGSNEERLAAFRRVREELREFLQKFPAI